MKIIDVFKFTLAIWLVMSPVPAIASAPADQSDLMAGKPVITEKEISSAINSMICARQHSSLKFFTGMYRDEIKRTDVAFEALRYAFYKNSLECAKVLVPMVNNIDRKHHGEKIIDAAIKTGDPSLISMVIDAGCDPDGDRSVSERPLAVAVGLGRLEAVRALVEKGASVNPAEARYGTPLYYACKKGHYGIAGYLLDMGADPNSAYNPDHLPLRSALEMKDHYMALYLISRGADPGKLKCRDLVEYKDLIRGGPNFVVSKLHFARCGPRPQDSATAKDDRAGGHNAPANDKKNTPGSAFVAAVKNRDLKKVREMIAAGADVNAVDEYRETAAYYAVSGKMSEMIDILAAAGADLNVKSHYSGHSLIMTAMDNKNYDIVRQLIEKGADPRKAGSPGRELLNKASSSDRADIVRLAIERGCSVNEADRHLETPIFDAVSSGSTETVRLLISSSAEVNLSCSSGETPLVIAAGRGFTGIASMLIVAGARINTFAVRHAPEERIEEIHGNTAIVSMLLPKRDEAWYIDDNNLSPIHAAALSDKPFMVRFLADKGADVNARTEKKMTPLGLSVMKKLDGIFDVLVSLGADIKACDQRGYAPIHIAAECDNGYAASKLLELGAGIDAACEGANADTPLIIAERSGSYRVVSMLRERKADEFKKNSLGETCAQVRSRRLAAGEAWFDECLSPSGEEHFRKIADSVGESFTSICHVACGCDTDPGPSKYRPSFLAMSDIQKTVWLNAYDAFELFMEEKRRGAENANCVKAAFADAVKLKRRRFFEYIIDKRPEAADPKAACELLKGGLSDIAALVVKKGIVRPDTHDRNGLGVLSAVDPATAIAIIDASPGFDFDGIDMLDDLSSLFRSKKPAGDTVCVELVKKLRAAKFSFRDDPGKYKRFIDIAIDCCGPTGDTAGVEIVRLFVEGGASMNVPDNIISVELNAIRSINRDLIDYLISAGFKFKRDDRQFQAMESFDSKCLFAKSGSEIDALYPVLEEFLEMLDARFGRPSDPCLIKCLEEAVSWNSRPYGTEFREQMARCRVNAIKFLERYK